MSNTKLSLSATSERRPAGWLARLLAAAWQLAQVFWVGPLVALHLCIPVALAQAGWAPLLTTGLLGGPALTTEWCRLVT